MGMSRGATVRTNDNAIPALAGSTSQTIWPNYEEEMMTFYEFSIIAVALIVLGGMRFGIPALVMWLFSQVNHHYTHA